MSRWRNKAIINLLKKRKENKDHAIAAKEWEFTGTVIDHLTSDNRCQLCEGENLRYHFEIKNKIKQESLLLVGSSCIRNLISLFLMKVEEKYLEPKNHLFYNTRLIKKNES